MNESNELNPRKKVPAWSLALLLIPVIALLAYTYFSNSGPASTGGGSDPDTEFVFDPAQVKELEIKGAVADGSASWSDVTVPPSPPADEKLLARGKELFSKACAACHGDEGRGDGPALSRLGLNSSPADFTKPIASIKIRSTQRGTLPADDDLFRTITRGLPGTAMLSFRNLPENDRWALVHRVAEFFKGAKHWPAAKPLAMPAKLPSDAGLIEEGHREFAKWCQNCHGPDAMGGTSIAFQMQRAYPAIRFARGSGKFMLRGSKPEDIATTLLAGCSGSSPMMSFQPTFYGDEANANEIKEGDRKLWGTAYYARKIIDERSILK